MTSLQQICTAGLFALVISAGSARALPATTWNFSANCNWTGQPKCAAAGSAAANGVTGNVYSFAGASGPAGSISAEAYHVAPPGGGQPNNPMSTALRKDFLSYGGPGQGLGVQNISTPDQGIDNGGGWDFVIFQLPSGTGYNTFDIDLGSLGAARGMDVTVFYGTPDPSLIISSLQSFYLKTVNQLLNGGFMSMTFKGLFQSSTIQTVTVASTSPVNYLIVAASLEPLRITDNFKVNAIVGSTAVRVPEPVSLGLLLAGLGGLAWIRRRRAGRAPC